MGTSTSTTFGPNGPTVVTTGGTVRPTTIRPVTVRALEAQTTRLERDSQRQQRDQQQAQATAFYRGQGEYSTLGAEGGYRPRGTVTSGGVPIGQAVPANNGLVGGMPAGSTGDPAGLAQTTERLATVAQERGPQVGEGNPNDAEAAPRYPQDHYYDSVTGNLWQWELAEGETPGVWVLISGVIEAIDVAIDVPANRSYLIVFSQRYPCRIEALHQPTVSYTVAISPVVGETVAVEGQITLTLSGIPDAEGDPAQPSLSVSIETRRLG
jgi:hypothetical protein